MVRINTIDLYLNYDSIFAKRINFANIICMCLADEMVINGDLTK